MEATTETSRTYDCDPVKKNPMEHSLIVDKICTYLPLKDLLTCRMVNHSWNSSIAPTLFHRNRFNIRLTDRNIRQHLIFLIQGRCSSQIKWLPKYSLQIPSHIRENQVYQMLEMALGILEQTAPNSIHTLNMEYVWKAEFNIDRFMSLFYKITPGIIKFRFGEQLLRVHNYKAYLATILLSPNLKWLSIEGDLALSVDSYRGSPIFEFLLISEMAVEHAVLSKFELLALPFIQLNSFELALQLKLPNLKYLQMNVLQFSSELERFLHEFPLICPQLKIITVVYLKKLEFNAERLAKKIPSWKTTFPRVFKNSFIFAQRARFALYF